MTLLELVNRVLRRLREDQVGDFSEEYSKLIVEFIADTQREIIDAHDWSVMDLLEETTVTAEFGTATTAVPVGSMRREIAGCTWHDSVGDQQGEILKVVHRDVIKNMTSMDRSQITRPEYIAFYPDDDGFIHLDVFPVNADAGTVRTHWWIPEEIVTTETDDSYEFVTPEKPLLLGTLFLALNERGEELGEPGGIAERRYYDALAAAKEVDIQLRGNRNEYEFYRD